MGGDFASSASLDGEILRNLIISKGDEKVAFKVLVLSLARHVLTYFFPGPLVTVQE